MQYAKKSKLVIIIGPNNQACSPACTCIKQNSAWSQLLPLETGAAAGTWMQAHSPTIHPRLSTLFDYPYGWLGFSLGTLQGRTSSTVYSVIRSFSQIIFDHCQSAQFTATNMNCMVLWKHIHNFWKWKTTHNNKDKPTNMVHLYT